MNLLCGSLPSLRLCGKFFFFPGAFAGNFSFPAPLREMFLDSLCGKCIMNAQTQTMITLTIDGKAVTVPKGTTVYNAAKQLGIDIPIFCYMDRMPPFGACRMCLVEVEKMRKLQTSCTLEATEGMVVKTQSTMATDGRKDIIEFLLINHPLDCPICDRGGECPLQENTLKCGPGESRFYEEKRHFKKPIPLGPVLMLDRERCIVCARCTRFGDIVAGDHALELIDRGFKTEVGTPDGKPAESKFIGNTIMICPVGALTSEVYRFRARPWDNNHTESTCTLCPVGCSMILDSRDGEIMRTRSLENRAVNDVWLCDKGWFGYEYTSHLDRLQHPLIRKGDDLQPASWDDALSLIASKIEEFKPNGKLAGIGGTPLTTEENFLFQRLMREGAGVNHVDHRVGMPIFNLDEEGISPGMEIPIGDCEDLSYAILCGIDITEEFPVIWLRLKQAIHRGATVIFLGHYAPEISPQIAKTTLHAPGNEINIIQQALPEIAKLATNGKKGAIFVGRQYLATKHRRSILAELSKFQLTTANLSLNIMEGRGNSMGARLAGMHPELGPNGERLSNPGLNAVQVIETAAQSGWDLLYVAGADPAMKFPSVLWKKARAKLGFLVVQDLFLTETVRQADVVLPTLCFVEKEGSFVNIHGLVQRLRPGKDIPHNIYSDAKIFRDLGERLNLFEKEYIIQAPVLQHRQIKPDVSNKQQTAQSLAATFAPALFDHGVRMKHNPHLIQLAKEPRIRLHPQDGAKRGLQNGQRVTVKANNSTLSAKVKLDDKVAEGTVVLPLGFEECPVRELGANLMCGCAVEIMRE